MRPVKARRDVRIDHLREVLLFEGCTDDQLREIASRADEIAVPAGYVLVYEGDWGHEVFVVADGSARVTVGGRAVAELGPGSVIGELAVLNPGPRTATVTASTSMRFFVFDQDAFEELLERHTLVARRTMAEVAGRFQRQAADLLDVEQSAGS